jgi:glycosyltransferase involved in cell wall biosynthesis
LPINPVANYSESHLLNMADAIASVSVYTKNLTKKIFNLNKPIEILYNSIPVPDLPLQERDDNTIIFTGSLLKKKGIFSLLRAWNRIHEKYPSAQLYIYGKGAIENIPEYVEEKALPTIHFKGHVNIQQLMNVFKSATMAIFPSYSECFAFAPMEAMSMGCPVIFTKRSSGPELITDGENGLLVDPDNIEEIAEKISLLLTQKTLRKKIAKNGAKRIQESFNIEKSVIDHTVFYLNVIQKRKAIEEAELLL